MKRPIIAVYVAADEDEPLRKKLETHLALLEQQGKMQGWHAQQILAGSVSAQRWEEAMKQASLIVLLISADFFASLPCREQMEQALAWQRRGAVRVIPILLRAVDGKEAPFAHLKMLPTNGVPITTWPNPEEAFAEVAVGIRRVIEEGSSPPAAVASKEWPSVWMIPYPRNPFFTGRNAVLDDLHQRFKRGQAQAVSQPQAMSGLGGIGKTQIAVEYAYCYREEYQQVLWASAETEELLTVAYTQIATKLDLPEKGAKEQEVIVEAVKLWLQKHQGWLLILDNADEPEVLEPFLPPSVGGHLLVTTRASDLTALGLGFGHSLEIETFTVEQGALFLLHRAGLLALDATMDQAKAEERQRAMELSEELGGLPLALDQAGAYIAQTHCTLECYRQLYQTHRKQLLKERRGKKEHPDPVATTWKLSFERVETANAAAAELLRLCSFLAPDAIPEWMLTKGAAQVGSLLAPVVTDGYLLDQAVEALRAYSLIGRERRGGAASTLSVHRLVQAVLQDEMKDEEKHQWAERTIRAMQAICTALPPGEPAHWPDWERIMPHAQLCAQHIKVYKMHFTAATDLLREIGLYLIKRAQYKEAEEICQMCLNILTPVSLLPRAIILINLGNISSETGAYPKAKNCYKESLKIFEQHKELDRREFARLLNNLAIIYKVLGEPEEAEKLYIRSLNMQIQSFVASGEALGKPGEAKKKQSAPDDLDIATLSEVLSTSQEKIHRSICCLLNEKTAMRKFAHVLNNLAVLSAELHQYERADRLFHLSLWLQK